MATLYNHLNDIAQLFSDLDDRWRAGAFVNAARVISKTSNLTFKDGVLQDKIPGVGKAIKEVIEEFTATGTSRKFNKLTTELAVKSKTKKPEGVISYLKETTEKWNTDYRVPCHTYIIENSKCIGYIREGTREVKTFSKPLNFEKGGRTFNTLTKKQFEAIQK